MKRIKIYEYDKKNREAIVEAINAENGQIISWALYVQEGSKLSFPSITESIYIDISSLFANEDRASASIVFVEKIIAQMVKTAKYRMHLIVERQYSIALKDTVYYRISEIASLENLLHIENCTLKNIADISQNEFDEITETVNKTLFGNNEFKDRLKAELEKFRLFNITGHQPIFSVLLCGNAGIGKTELARILHRALAPNEPMIKLNFGNYSSENSLNSLIGSPRGYVGSNKGELSEKLSVSRSTVILIDEFEKANKPVYNFFLQLLEDGRFTDSLGRDYDLNKYIIIFTSNLEYEKISEVLSPELRSRFNIMAKLNLLGDDEKYEYMSFKVDEMLSMIKPEVRESVTEEQIAQIKDIDVSQFTDMRKLNAQIMHNIAAVVYPIISEISSFE